jgi:hypothetical protein
MTDRRSNVCFLPVRLVLLRSATLSGLGALLLIPTSGYAQSALPQFSNPYGTIDTSPAADAPPPQARTPRARLPELTRASKRHMVPSHAMARKKIAGPGHIETPTRALQLQEESAARPVSLSHPQQQSDSALGFDLKWSAANNPYLSPSSSTVSAVDEVKRNANETPAETGSSLEAGVKLKF